MRRVAFVAFGMVAAALGAACSGPRYDAHPDAAPPAPDASPPARACTAAFSGNFAASVTLAANCAMVAAGVGSDGVDATTLAFAIPTTSPAPVTTFDISLELGDPAQPGAYSSETLASWSAMATVVLGSSRCFYVAGAASVPPGAFTLDLVSIDAGSDVAHGQLALTLALLPGTETNCGTDNAEQLMLAF